MIAHSEKNKGWGVGRKCCRLTMYTFWSLLLSCSLFKLRRKGLKKKTKFWLSFNLIGKINKYILKGKAIKSKNLRGNDIFGCGLGVGTGHGWIGILICLVVFFGVPRLQVGEELGLTKFYC